MAKNKHFIELTEKNTLENVFSKYYFSVDTNNTLILRKFNSKLDKQWI